MVQVFPSLDNQSPQYYTEGFLTPLMYKKVKCATFIQIFSVTQYLSIVLLKFRDANVTDINTIVQP